MALGIASEVYGHQPRRLGKLVFRELPNQLVGDVVQLRLRNLLQDLAPPPRWPNTAYHLGCLKLHNAGTHHPHERLPARLRSTFVETQDCIRWKRLAGAIVFHDDRNSRKLSEKSQRETTPVV